MKCPLCDNKMEPWGPAAPDIYECMQGACPAYRISLNCEIIRAIRRRLKKEWQAGYQTAVEEVK